MCMKITTQNEIAWAMHRCLTSGMRRQNSCTSNQNLSNIVMWKWLFRNNLFQTAQTNVYIFFSILKNTGPAEIRYTQVVTYFTSGQKYTKTLFRKIAKTKLTRKHFTSKSSKKWPSRHVWSAADHSVAALFAIAEFWITKRECAICIAQASLLIFTIMILALICNNAKVVLNLRFYSITVNAIASLVLKKSTIHQVFYKFCSVLPLYFVLCCPYWNTFLHIKYCRYFLKIRNKIGWHCKKLTF